MQIKSLSESRKHIVFKIITPVLLTILLFVISSFFIIIPSIEKNYMANKRELIKELTHTAVSTLSYLESLASRREITTEQAKQRAADHIRNLRYGEDNKDYFWVSNLKPEMIVHPYRQDLEGKDMGGVTDRSGLPIFLKFVDIAKSKGAGYLTYTWQFKDQAGIIVPKLSYVKAFEPWGWIVGTGVYTEDVKARIALLKKRLTQTCVIITLAVCLLLFYLMRQSLAIERQRNDYARDLSAAKEKYKALVQASGEGILLVMANEEFFANKTLRQMTGFSNDQLKEIGLDRLFDMVKPGLKISSLPEPAKSPGTFEARLKQRNGKTTDVMVCVSPIEIDKKTGHILSVRDISAVPEVNTEQKAKKEQENLLAQLQTALLYLNQPVLDLADEIPRYDASLSVQALSRLMSKHQKGCVLICDEAGKPAGLITDSDIRRRVVSLGLDTGTRVSEIMSYPLISIPETAMVYEAIAKMKQNGLRHLLIKDRSGEITRHISARQLILNHQYSLSFLSQDINTAQTAEEMFDLKDRIPQLITTLVNCGARPANIGTIMTTISEAVLNRLIQFALDALGPPPAKFAFIVMGSVGRREQTLKTDQDNAIIIEDLADEIKAQQAKDYFLKLGKKVCTWLDRIGYAYCKGDVMAQNPKWCVPLQTWKSYFKTWVLSGSPQDLLDTKIFFDFRFAAGEKTLVTQLRSNLGDLMGDKSAFTVHLVRNCLLFKPPIGLFKKIIVEPLGEHREKISLKKAMTPIVDLARIYTLKTDKINTLERIEHLHESGLFNLKDTREIKQAYAGLMQLRLQHQSNCLSRNEPADNYIDPHTLTRSDQIMLKEILSVIAGFQSRLASDFKTNG